MAFDEAAVVQVRFAYNLDFHANFPAELECSILEFCSGLHSAAEGAEVVVVQVHFAYNLDFHTNFPAELELFDS